STLHRPLSALLAPRTPPLFPYTTLFRSLDQPPLQTPRGPLTSAVGVDQHRQHHRRVIDGTTTTIIAIRPIEPSQIQLGDHIEDRSEEHTSELQSRFDLVCRLLLEKKKRT